MYGRLTGASSHATAGGSGGAVAGVNGAGGAYYQPPPAATSSPAGAGGFYQHNVSAAVDSMRNMHVSHSSGQPHSGSHGLLH